MFDFWWNAWSIIMKCKQTSGAMRCHIVALNTTKLCFVKECTAHLYISECNMSVGEVVIMTRERVLLSTSVALYFLHYCNHVSIFLTHNLPFALFYTYKPLALYCQPNSLSICTLYLMQLAVVHVWWDANSILLALYAYPAQGQCSESNLL